MSQQAEASSESQSAYTSERYDPLKANALAFYDHHARYHFVRERFGGPSRSLLDVGCGLGVGTQVLRGAFERAVGVDVSDEAIADARANRAAEGLEFFTIKAYAKAGRGATFDVVTCLEVIEHTFEQDALLKLIRKHLAPRGFAIISTPNKVHTQAHGILNPYHVNELEEDAFKALIGRHFPHAELYAMVQVNGVVVAPVEELASKATVETIYQIPDSTPWGQAARREVTNFVAVCSLEPLPDFRGLSLLDPASTYVNQLGGIIRSQAGLVDGRDEALAQQTRMIDDRDDALESQRRMIQDRDGALVSQESMIRERDAQLRSKEAELGELREQVRRLDAMLSRPHYALLERLTQPIRQLPAPLRRPLVEAVRWASKQITAL